LKVLFMGIIRDRTGSVVACKEIASWTPSSCDILGISGAIPEVEMVTLDLLSPIPHESVNILTARDTFFQLYSGSPWPINTTLSITPCLRCINMN
jgi:hypothetical protein